MAPLELHSMEFCIELFDAHVCHDGIFLAQLIKKMGLDTIKRRKNNRKAEEASEMYQRFEGTIKKPAQEE